MTGKRKVYAHHQIAKGLRKPRKGGLDVAHPKLLRKSIRAKTVLTGVTRPESLLPTTSWWRISLDKTLSSGLWRTLSLIPDDTWVDLLDSKIPSEAAQISNLWQMAMLPQEDGGLGLRQRVLNDAHKPTQSIGTPGELIIFSLLWHNWTPPPFRDMGNAAYQIRIQEDNDPIDLAINVGGVFVYVCVKSSIGKCSLQSSEAFYSTVSKDVMQTTHPTMILRFRVSYVDRVNPLGAVLIQVNVLRNWNLAADELRNAVNALRA